METDVRASGHCGARVAALHCGCGRRGEPESTFGLDEGGVEKLLRVELPTLGLGLPMNRPSSSESEEENSSESSGSSALKAWYAAYFGLETGVDDVNAALLASWAAFTDASLVRTLRLLEPGKIDESAETTEGIERMEELPS